MKFLKVIPYFQPKIDLTTSSIFGAEIFLKLMDIDKNILGYPYAQTIFSQNGLYELDLILYEKALNFISLFNYANKELSYSFNVPACNTEQLKRYFNQAHSLIKQYSNISTNQIDFELLEENVLDDEMLSIFKAYSNEFGFEFSLDDFGVAHSNLERLFYCQKLIQFIKLDKFLINNKDNCLIKHFFNFISALSKDLNFKIIVEGIDSIDQVQFLLQNNIRYAQGFYFHQPLPPISFFKLIS